MTVGVDRNVILEPKEKNRTKWTLILGFRDHSSGLPWSLAWIKESNFIVAGQDSLKNINLHLSARKEKSQSLTLRA